jgi:hypothetical protein
MIASRQIAFGKAAGKKEEPPAYWGLCFTAEENGSTVAMETVLSPPAVTLETSFDGEIWEPFYVGETTITLPKVGDKVYFRAGEGGNIALANTNQSYNKFSLVTGRIAASGNVMSLLNGDMPDSALSNYCFVGLFRNCTSLVTAPELPATNLATLCYSTMFFNCTSLITAPKLPATNLAVTSCMAMFSNCKNLNSIEVAFSTFPPSTTNNWVSGVSPTGTFVCPTALGTNDTIKRGVSACPEGWTVINKD